MGSIDPKDWKKWEEKEYRKKDKRLKRKRKRQERRKPVKIAIQKEAVLTRNQSNLQALLVSQNVQTQLRMRMNYLP